MTTLQECYAELGGGVSSDDIVRRLGSEALVAKYLNSFLRDENFAALETALASRDVEAAFRAVHSLKGICQNFDFKALGASASALTEALRGGSYGNDVDGLFSQVKQDYRATYDAVARYCRGGGA
ncbi:Hpt domain-containing protein [Arabiibacter massiliensis]|uniref:Hpt domain-containing protein n=1 Tax=Arabiibacter massiliensis TaxID=1870985 RepID=UPI0009BA8AE1|nr:Hpt domain-containing protein [Arabiibacter massiliensis]